MAATSSASGGLDGTVRATIPGAFVNGARWVGDGRYLAFGGDATYFGAGESGVPVVVVAQADGGALHVATGPATDASFAAAIGNGGCAAAPGVGSGVTAFGVLGLLGLRVARRRKRA